MAEKRMFSRCVVCSDAFLDMPADAQLLYFQLNMAADDRGICDRPRSIMRAARATDDTMKILIAKKFVLLPVCNSQVVVIKHWRINNNMRSQRFRETKYTDVLNELFYDENKGYSQNPGDGHIPCLSCGQPDLPALGQPMVNQRSTQVGSQRSTQVGSQRSTQVGSQRSTQNRVEENRVEENRVEENRVEENRVEEFKISPLSKSVRKGECEGENPMDGLTEKKERIAYWKKQIVFMRNVGFDSRGLYALAATEGITREEIDSYEDAGP